MKNDARHFACNADARQGWQARLRLGFDCDAHGTRLAERCHTGPLRVQKALYPEGPAVCHAVIVHPPGGVVGGDALDIAISAANGAQALLTTPGAGKWYRANGRPSHQDVRIAVGANAALEWLPQETLFYREAEVEMTHQVSLAADARYIGSEILCFGRTASGETFGEGTVRQTSTIRRDGQLVWHEEGRIDGTGAAMHGPFGLDGNTVCATLVACGVSLDASQLRQLREELDRAGGRSGVTLLPQTVVVRHLGRSSEAARGVLLAAWVRLRPLLLGRPAALPRLWTT
jgi:urease accessory protein